MFFNKLLLQFIGT